MAATPLAPLAAIAGMRSRVTPPMARIGTWTAAAMRLRPVSPSRRSAAGFERIPLYGPYVDDPRSVCLQKQLDSHAANRIVSQAR